MTIDPILLVFAFATWGIFCCWFGWSAGVRRR